MLQLRRLLLLGGLVTAIIGQMTLSENPSTGIALLGCSLAAALVEGWLWPRPLRSIALMAGIIALLGLMFWREPRGWFFLALGLIQFGTSMRAPRPAVTPAKGSDGANSPVTTGTPDADPTAAASETAVTAEAWGTAPEVAPLVADVDAQSLPEPRYGMALLWGVGAAVAGAVAWFAVTKVTGWNVGIVAVGVGLLVGYAMRRAAGRGTPSLQVLAAFLGGLGILGGYYLIIRDIFATVIAQKGMSGLSEVELSVAIVMFVTGHPDVIGPLGALFILIGIYEAWKSAR